MARLSLPAIFRKRPAEGTGESWSPDPGASASNSAAGRAQARAARARPDARRADPRPRRPDARDVPARPVQAGPPDRAVPRSDLGRGAPPRDRRPARGRTPRLGGRASAVRCTCGAPIQWGSHFCANCGRPVGEEPVVACPNCGTAIPADAQFCANCGTPGSREHAAGRRKAGRGRADDVPAAGGAFGRSLGGLIGGPPPRAA